VKTLIALIAAFAFSAGAAFAADDMKSPTTDKPAATKKKSSKAKSKKARKSDSAANAAPAK
jgi:hypothetical protein